MSDDDRDVDVESLIKVESDEDDDSDPRQSSLQRGGNQYYSQAEKRAHHNALERKRRDHIKDSFSSLRDAVPALNGEKASRAQILKKAAEYIMFMRKKNTSHQQDIEDLKRQNTLLEAQIRTLEKAKAMGTYSLEANDLRESSYNETESDMSDNESSQKQRKVKKLKSFH